MDQVIDEENSVHEDDGTGLAMFSRSGKSTSYHYLAFQDKNRHQNVVGKVMAQLGLGKETKEQDESKLRIQKALD